MELHTLTLLSHRLFVYLSAPVIVLLIVSVRKEAPEGQPLKGFFGAVWVMMALCAAVVLCVGLHHATTLRKAANSFEIRQAH